MRHKKIHTGESLTGVTFVAEKFLKIWRSSNIQERE
jgi:hypothetical protein